MSHMHAPHNPQVQSGLSVLLRPGPSQVHTPIAALQGFGEEEIFHEQLSLDIDVGQYLVAALQDHCNIL